MNKLDNKAKVMWNAVESTSENVNKELAKNSSIQDCWKGTRNTLNGEFKTVAENVSNICGQTQIL